MSWPDIRTLMALYDIWCAGLIQKKKNWRVKLEAGYGVVQNLAQNCTNALIPELYARQADAAALR